MDKTEAFVEKEFPMTASNFDFIKAVAYEKTGIKLSDHKKNMIYSRLARRLRELGLSHFDDYCEILAQDSHPELSNFINAITTNLTAFFREPHHFDYIREQLAPGLIQKARAGKRIRVWSAGCSTGEEPYSIAITLRDLLPATAVDMKILATDLDTNVVKTARAGIYSKDRIKGLDESICKRWFMHNTSTDSVKIKEPIKNLITFNPLNLLHSWPMKGPFDIIFCRNVVIYFDKETQKYLFNKFADMLTHDGHLFIGHSESLNNVSSRFKGLGKTIYQRIS